MSRLILRLCAASSLSAAVFCLTLASPIAAIGQMNGGDGQYQQHGQDGNGQGTQDYNPMVGSWMSRTQQQDGSTMYSFSEYAANGSTRGTSIIKGGVSNGMRMQLWGHYTMKKVGEHRYAVTFRWDGFAPRQMCIQGGSCQAAPQPEEGTEIETFQDGDHFHSHAEIQGNSVDVDLQRSQVPPELQTQVSETLTMQAPQQQQQIGGQGSTPYAGSRYQSPVNKIPGIGGNCDDAQQNRICTINNHAMYTDSRGCRVCAP